MSRLIVTRKLGRNAAELAELRGQIAQALTIRRAAS